MRFMISFSGLPHIKLPPAKANNDVRSSLSEVQSICKRISTLEHRCYCTQEKVIEEL